MARKSASNPAEIHAKEFESAKKFVRKYFRAMGSGISFNRENGSFGSYVTIESKYGVEKDVPWWVRTSGNMSIRLSADVAIVVEDGKLVNTMDSVLLASLIQGMGVGDYGDGLSYNHSHEWYEEQLQAVYDNLHINEGEFINILCDLYLDKIITMINKSLPVAQKSYDKWIEKGCVATQRKERIASTFGDDFVKALVDGICSFHDEYIRIETAKEIDDMKERNRRCGKEIYKESEMQERAEKLAEGSWRRWSQYEVGTILDILLRYDAGKCVSFDIRFDKSSMTVEGNIHGDTGKRLNFHTIFAGGYNIQRLHTRTIAHVFDN